jgi:hypothetical protein
MVRSPNERVWHFSDRLLGNDGPLPRVVWWRAIRTDRPFVAFATWSPWARLLQAVCKPLQGRLQGASTECSAFPIDPSRVDSYDMSQPYAHRAEIDRLEQRPGSTSGSAARVGQ